MPTATQRRFAPVAQVTEVDGHSSHEVKAIDRSWGGFGYYFCQPPLGLGALIRVDVWESLRGHPRTLRTPFCHLKPERCFPSRAVILVEQGITEPVRGGKQASEASGELPALSRCVVQRRFVQTTSLPPPRRTLGRIHCSMTTVF